MCRYSVIREKNPREIVLLRGRGCAWKRCRFCDYHLDRSSDDEANFALNRAVLEKVTGEYQRLEAINSGSFAELDERTMESLVDTCVSKGITKIHFESHWMYRHKIAALRERFGKAGVQVIIKIGVESFDEMIREEYLDKGMRRVTPEEIAAYFDECCLLQGISGQSAASMEKDIKTGLAHFRRVCVNIMQPCSAPVGPDKAVVAAFLKEVYPQYRYSPRVDILLSNTDFGVGGMENAQ